MDKRQLVKILNWNISTEPDIDIDKVLEGLKGFPVRPNELIKNLEAMKRSGVKKVDRIDMVKALERL